MNLSSLKYLLRETFIRLHLDVTKNLSYDRLTRNLIKIVLTKTSNTVDVGCHKGEILAQCISSASQARHYGFEPIPQMYNELKKKFTQPNVFIYPYALFDEEKTASFFVVEKEKGYSSLKNRELEFESNKKEIQVQTKKLDDIVADKIDFIKIDVEGAELQVLKGAVNMLKQSQPIIHLECGKGGYDYFNKEPMEIFTFLQQLNYSLFKITEWQNKNAALTQQQFFNLFETNEEYYFVALPNWFLSKNNYKFAA